VSLDNDDLRVTVLVEGGHIAEVCDKQTGLNPLWIPSWDSVEPSAFSAVEHGPVFGTGPDAKLLAGIMGHNLCLDLFGGPSAEEARSGMTAHGDASVAEYDIAADGDEAVMRAWLPRAHIQFERQIRLHGGAVRVRERVKSMTAFDRPIGWTQHVTLGAPFLEKGRTEFRASAKESRVLDSTFGVADYLESSASFVWPTAPRVGGGTSDLRLFTNEPTSSAYTAHLMDRTHRHAFFVAYSPSAQLAFGYVWRRDDFPWLGIWEENYSRTAPPWNGRALTRGMEFGVSPYPESRRAMVDRGRLFDTPTFRWLPAGETLEATYWIVMQSADAIPERLEWPRDGDSE
jgi:hypothetical protein